MSIRIAGESSVLYLRGRSGTGRHTILSLIAMRPSFCSFHSSRCFDCRQFPSVAQPVLLGTLLGADQSYPSYGEARKAQPGQDQRRSPRPACCVICGRSGWASCMWPARRERASIRLCVRQRAAIGQMVLVEISRIRVQRSVAFWWRGGRLACARCKTGCCVLGAS